MTVATTTQKVQYSGDDSTVAFAFSYLFYANADLRVILTDANEVETVQVLDTDYTVTGAGLQAGGTVTMTTAPATGETLTIKGDLEKTQPDDFDNNATIYLETLEKRLDKLTIITQQIQEEMNRTARYKETNADTPPDLEDIEAGFDHSLAEGKVFIGNASGTAIASDALADMKDSGFVSWDAAVTWSVDLSDKFKVETAGTGRIHGKLVSWVANQETAALSANTANYIYIDSDGVLQSTTTRTEALYEDNIVLFIDMFDGTNHVVVKENHPYKFCASVSNYLHDTLKTVIENIAGGANITRVATGGGGAAGDREIKIVGADELEDHGLDTDIPDSGGSGVTWNQYYTNASGKWIRDASQTQFVMKYNNAGTATAITANQYGVFRLKVAKDDIEDTTPKYIAVMHTAQFASLALARTAIINGVANDSNELTALEMAQLGYIIVHNNGGGYIAEVQIVKEVATGNTTGGGASNLASLISTDISNFDHRLSSADTNVQQALETLQSVKRVHTVVLKWIKYDTALAAGDGAMFWTVPEEFNGMNIIGAQAHVYTASTSGLPSFQLHNLTSAADILSTNITIDANEKDSSNALTPPVIDTAEDDLTTADEIRVDVDAIGTGTEGGEIRLRIQLP
jgi:hypothetical protein